MSGVNGHERGSHALKAELKNLYALHRDGKMDGFETAMKRLVIEFSCDRKKFAEDLERFPDDMEALYDGGRENGRRAKKE